jgi:hypothetical protein
MKPYRICSLRISSDPGLFPRCMHEARPYCLVRPDPKCTENCREPGPRSLTGILQGKHLAPSKSQIGKLSWRLDRVEPPPLADTSARINEDTSQFIAEDIFRRLIWNEDLWWQFVIQYLEIALWSDISWTDNQKLKLEDNRQCPA